MRLLHDPTLIWIVVLAYLSTVLGWPAKTWRAWTTVVCWVICLLVVLLHLVR